MIGGAPFKASGLHEAVVLVQGAADGHPAQLGDLVGGVHQHQVEGDVGQLRMGQQDVGGHGQYEPLGLLVHEAVVLAEAVQVGGQVGGFALEADVLDPHDDLLAEDVLHIQGQRGGGSGAVRAGREAHGTRAATA